MVPRLTFLVTAALAVVGCGGTIEASKPRVALECDACKAPRPKVEVDTPIVVSSSWSGTCDRLAIGVEGSRNNTETCDEQSYQSSAECTTGRCDVERIPDRGGAFTVTPRDVGTIEITITFVPQPQGLHRKVRELVDVVAKPTPMEGAR
jgi:hypothetical protein